PTLAQSHIGIGTSHRLIEYLLIKNPHRGLAAYGPNGRRWRERLRLARDPSAMPGSDAYKAVAAEAAESGDAMDNHMRHVGLGQHSGNRFSGAAGDAVLDWGQAVQLRPELLGIPQAMPGHFPKRRMFFSQNERTPARLESL